MPFRRPLPRLLIPIVIVVLTGSAYAVGEAMQHGRIDGAEGVGLNLATTTAIVIGVGAFIVWAMRVGNAIELRTTALENDRNAILKRLDTAQQLADTRTKILISRIEHERARRKAGERVIRRIASKIGDDSRCPELDSDGSLAGADSVDLLDLEGA